MSTEKMRDEFEAWYLDKFCGGQARLFRCVNADQIYYFAEVQSRWDAWQASRAAIEVELPELHTVAPDDDKKWHGCRNSTIRTCARAIELVGLRVKP